MNLDNMNKLIEHLENLPEGQFDWRHWYSQTECGTQCCVAGWACVLANPEKFNGNNPYFPYDSCAMLWLDLTKAQANLIFYPIEGAYSVAKDNVESISLNFHLSCHVSRYMVLYSDDKIDLIREDLKLIKNLIGKENLGSLTTDSRLMAKLLRAYAEKWHKEEKEFNHA